MSFSNPLILRIACMFKASVMPLPGSIVYRKYRFAEHTGIYIGDNSIIELDGGGHIKKVSFIEFCKGNPIYVACDHNGYVLYDDRIHQRAQKMVGIRRSYNLLFDNCHQFVAGCILGDFENGNHFFFLVERCVKKYFKISKLRWRILDEQSSSS